MSSQREKCLETYKIAKGYIAVFEKIIDAEVSITCDFTDHKKDIKCQNCNMLICKKCTDIDRDKLVKIIPFNDEVKLCSPCMVVLSFQVNYQIFSKMIKNGMDSLDNKTLNVTKTGDDEPEIQFTGDNQKEIEDDMVAKIKKVEENLQLLKLLQKKAQESMKKLPKKK
jgi:hypothetical protein